MKEKTGTDQVNKQEDLTKPAGRYRNLAGEILWFISEAAADVFGGIAEAHAEAFRRFREEITPENVTRVGLSNGILEGATTGNVRFFEEIAKASKRFSENLRTYNQNAEKRMEEPIDYERLAKLVADEMRKEQESKK